MKITKYGHCCLLVEEKELRLLTDPGTYSRDFTELTEIDVILITHEHADHLHVESLKELLKRNPYPRIYTTQAVKEILEKEGIPSKVLKHGEKIVEKGVEIEAIGEKHAAMHPAIPQSTNVGFFIQNNLFYPGDALTLPGKPVKWLALPVIAPWMKMSEAIDYAIAVKPKGCFPVHEGILIHPGFAYRVPPMVLEKQGIKWIVPEHATPFEIGK